MLYIATLELYHKLGMQLNVYNIMLVPIKRENYHLPSEILQWGFCLLISFKISFNCHEEQAQLTRRHFRAILANTKAITPVGGSTLCWMISTYPCVNHSQPLHYFAVNLRCVLQCIENNIPHNHFFYVPFYINFYLTIFQPVGPLKTK